MPELPEVETIRMGLEKYLAGHKIEKIDIRLPKIVTGDAKHITGAKFTKVERFGKGLVIHLDNGFVVAIHIKLTGQLIYRGVSPVFAKAMAGKQVSKAKVGSLPNKATHVIFKLKSQNAKGKREDAYLYYNDFRQFGWIKIVREDEVAKLPFFKELGPEFMKDLTLEMFTGFLSKSGSPIKVVIMDQQRMSGIGNIYANDGLNLAKIDPRKPAKKLSNPEIKKLFDSLLEVLKRGLKYGGASELSYVNALGLEGGYQDHFLAYGRKGEKCFNCGGVIEKITLGGRGTYFCERCQT